MSNNHYSLRVQKLQQQLSSTQIILISNPIDIDYFSGFKTLVPEEREAFLLVTPQKTLLIHALFSPADIPLACDTYAGCQPKQVAALIKDQVENTSNAELIIDEYSLTVHEYQPLKESGLKLVGLDRNMVWQIRMIKDKTEIELIQQAGEIASQTFDQVVGKNGKHLKSGITEQLLKKKLEATLTTLGSEKPAFPTIVAFGAHGALPHHQPTSKILKKETPVLIDFGATVSGYRSDMTRSFWFGQNPNQKFTEVAQTIDRAYQAALEQLSSSNLTAQNIDQTARDIISKAGFGKQFIHTTGHGVGLDIHEQPSLNSNNQTNIKPGMVITIEPGIYLSDSFGYRHENTILVTKKGFEQLT